MAEETGRAYWNAVALAAREDYGFGQAARPVDHGERRAVSAPQRVRGRLRTRVPATLHVAIGADITHMRAAHDGAALGLAAFRDFQVFAEVVKGLDDGGVYVNLGSAVALPRSS